MLTPTARHGSCVPTGRFGIHGDHSVEKFRTLEHLKAQLTVVRWHLDAAVLVNGDKKRRHLDSASLTYQGAVDLLAQLVLPDAEHAAAAKQLADLKERLRAAGQQV